MLKPLAIATFLAAILLPAPLPAAADPPGEFYDGPFTPDFVIDENVQLGIACRSPDDMMAVLRAGRIYGLTDSQASAAIANLAKLVAGLYRDERCVRIPAGSLAATTPAWIDGYFAFGIFKIVDGLGSFGTKGAVYYTPVQEWTLVR